MFLSLFKILFTQLTVLLPFYSRCNDQVPTIAIALGERGELSRLLAPKYGSFFTYVYLPEQGQLPTIHDYTKVYQGQRFTASTKVFGVIGKPISQSRGFLLYNAAMIEKGFDGVYLPFLVDDVELFFNTFTDFAGFRYLCDRCSF